VEWWTGTRHCADSRPPRVAEARTLRASGILQTKTSDTGSLNRHGLREKHRCDCLKLNLGSFCHLVMNVAAGRITTAGAKGGPDANDLTALGWGPPNEIGLREAHHCDVGNCSDCRDLQCPGVRQQWLGWRQEGTSHAVSHGRRGKGFRCSMEDQWSLSQDGDCRRVRDGARRCSANASTESSQSRWSATFAMTESQLGFARLRANPDSKEAIEFYRRLGMCVANWASSFLMSVRGCKPRWQI
jgi:hypothetical protein